MTFEDPGTEMSDPNRWQRLDIGVFIDKASQEVNGYPDFTTPQWGELTPFALRAADDARRDANGHWVWRDPGPPLQPSAAGRDEPMQMRPRPIWLQIASRYDSGTPVHAGGPRPKRSLAPSARTGLIAGYIHAMSNA